MMKVPDLTDSSPAHEDYCRQQCLENCSCIAYAYDIGTGCMSWARSLIDTQKFSSGGVDLYIRVAYSELDTKGDVIKIVRITVIIGTVFISICIFILWRWMAKHKARRNKANGILSFNRGEAHKQFPSENMLGDNLNQVEVQELPLFDFEKLASATNNFHQSNKLGQGGFGPVYKGKLLDGQEIAVKRLSKTSGQGLEEFMNEVVADTRRVVGTYGYMSPEYAIEGRFSEKSDVFGFGVLLLEIVSGRRITCFYDEEQSLTLLGLAWKLWNADNIVALIDPMIYEPCFEMEMLRCIHVGLLCVQELAKDRPTASVFVSMLKSEIVDLPRPKKPAYTERQMDLDTKSSQSSQNICSVNNVTITTMAQGR
ncbi:hypothetical protein CMV_002370 [Castanea mollissima]|uniref:Apple domain-containing protein n=1 Tax=Castanea mollissima TaxID=60419 RepID=A0A8J4RTR2_9ROSI|nr:hypothetical protein CMV_002370 [Castanea mollissima]